MQGRMHRTWHHRHLPNLPILVSTPRYISVAAALGCPITLEGCPIIMAKWYGRRIASSSSCAPPLMSHVHPTNGHYLSPSPTLLLISMERNGTTSTCPADGRRIDVEVDRDYAECGCGERRRSMVMGQQWLGLVSTRSLVSQGPISISQTHHGVSHGHDSSAI
jgi:hypothetical protein